MRILLIHHSFMTPDDGGGTRHFEFARYCVAQGDEFTVVGSTISYMHGRRVDRPRDEVVEGVRVLRAYIPPTFHRSFLWRIFAFIGFSISSWWLGLLYSRRADVVMGTTPSLFQAMSAATVALLRRKPFVLEVRDLWPEFAIDMGVLKNPMLIWLARRAEHWLYGRATQIIVNSPAYKTYLVERGVAEDRVAMVSNGVDPKMFDPDQSGQSMREQYQLEGKFVLVYAGAMGPANDIDTVLDAAGMLRDAPQVHFLLVGDGMSRTQLIERAAKEGLTNVTLPGVVPKEKMNAVLAMADACLAILMNIPMFKTTYPNKVFDYMAAGRPTVLAIDGVIREVIEASGGGIFVPPGDPVRLAEAVRRLCNDPEMARSMGRAAREYVEIHFNRAQQADEFRQVLHSTSNRYRRHPHGSDAGQTAVRPL